METKMDMQEAFILVYKGLKHQRCPSIRAIDGQCQYRGDNNARCAIGHLIPDSMYKVGMEGLTVENLCAMYSEVGNLFSLLDMSFLIDLQTAHDNTSLWFYRQSTNSWREVICPALERVANKYLLFVLY